MVAAMINEMISARKKKITFYCTTTKFCTVFFQVVHSSRAGAHKHILRHM